MADLHFGDKHCLYDEIQAHIDWVLDDPIHRFVCLDGDIFNAALKNSKSDVYEESLSMNEAMEKFIEMFTPIKDNIIIVTDGNHDRRVTTDVGVDPVKWCCNLLGVPYSAGDAFVTLKVGNWERNRRPDKKRSPVSYTLYMNHGTGGASSVGQSINAAMKRRDVVAADLYFSAHVHMPSATPTVMQEFDTRTGKVFVRDQFVVISRGFLPREGYPRAWGKPALSDRSAIVTLDGRTKYMKAEI